MLWKVEREKSN